MAAEVPTNKLRLAPSTAILAAPGWLYVLSRRGLARIQAEGVDKIHEKVGIYLDGSHDEEELLHAVPAGHRSALQKYLDALRRAGAIQRESAIESNGHTSGEQLPPLGKEDIGLDGIYHFSTEDQRNILVSLNGKVPVQENEYFAWVLFVTPEQMADGWKAIWRLKRRRPHIFCVVVLGMTATIEHRTMYARWLAGCGGIQDWKDCRARIYQLNSGEPTLSLIFEMEARPGSREQLAKANFVSPTSDPQLPLVVATAVLPFWRESITRFGLDYDRLSRELESQLVMRVTLVSDAVDGRVALLSAEEARKRFSRAHVNLNQALRWPVASSLLSARARALEHLLKGMSTPDSLQDKTVDFLQVCKNHLQVNYLSRILTLRVRELVGTVRQCSNGLFICQYQQHCSYSLVESKAVRDVLLMAARRLFYDAASSEALIGHDCDYSSSLPEHELQDLVMATEKRFRDEKGGRRFLFRRVRRWGHTAWIAHYEE
jgi:hypothetical protein